jgi:uncharacterized membrane protein
MRAEAPTEIVCPMCGGVNEPHAVFCKNPSCHKALGEFRYAIEELGKQSKWHVTLVNRIAGFIGRPHFVALHIVWVSVWIALNTGFILMGHTFDAYPFGLLALVLSIEAVLITSILIISNGKQTDLANTRAALDYEVNIQTYREIQEILRALDKIDSRLEALERTKGESE